ncbi:MAG: diguanylate cyclase [Onishia taeanensis]|uniref:sensor domain-containing diguanylate cyclase n=1 Tax=Onishia taeanensis TaxID=284577 RepID=UPI003C7A4D24
MPHDSWLRCAAALHNDVYLLLDHQLRISEQLGTLTDVDTTDLSGQMLTDCVAPDGMAALETTLSALLRRRLPGEVTTLWPNGNQTHWKAMPTPTAGLVLSRVRERQAGLGHDSLVSMIDALPVMVASIDNELRYRFVNASYEAFFGKTRGALCGQHIEVILGEATWKRLTPFYERVLSGERVQYEETLPLKDGSVLECRVQYVPDMAADGSVKGFFAAIEDVSEYGATIRLLKQIHHIVHNRPDEHDSTIDDLLTLALDFLGLEIGIVSQVSGDIYKVRHVVSQQSGLEPGAQFSLGETFCCLTLEADDVLGTVHAGEHPLFQGHPCYQRFPLESYIGVPLIINGEVWGTLNFSSPKARQMPFTALEIELVRLVGDAVEHLITRYLTSERWAKEREAINQLALTDALTGLPNRARIDRALDEVITRRYAISLAIIDIDFFKRINDRHGHDVGDRVLRGVAEALAKGVREGDLIGRLGGEEFMLLMHATPLFTARRVAERLRRAVESFSLPMDPEPPLSVTISLGLTQGRQDDDAASLYQRADHALYMAKHRGRNRIEVL